MTTRRQFIKMAGAGALIPSAWSQGSMAAPATPGSVTTPLQTGEVVVDLAGTLIKTLGYNGQIPGPEIRITEGERLRVPVTNTISESTLVHWHGISLVNNMDGTKLVQDPIAPGDRFDYDFVVPEAGSHWYHSHYGMQADMGMYGALIVEPRHEPLSYDREYTLVLDDWSDGIETGQSHGSDLAPTPEEEQATAPTGRRAGGYGSFSGGLAAWEDFEDELANTVSFGGRAYPFMLVNAKPPADPAIFDVKRGERIRLRVINAAADTAFRFAVAGHKMTVTHTDGMPVQPVDTDTIRIGMSERYDVIITADNPGAAQIGFMPEGKNGFGRAILRYTDAATSSLPPADFQPPELEQQLLSYDDLTSIFPAKVARNSTPDRVYNMTLHHTNIDVEGLHPDDPIMVSKGEIIRFNIRNESDNWHPMHMHGHHFHLANAGRPLKDVAVVAPRGSEYTWEWHADNPGKWMIHCHNLYHMKDGMMRTIFYE
jgi:FtsP/CotA-like multicopper oxidase with cupredoxin domain